MTIGDQISGKVCSSSENMTANPAIMPLPHVPWQQPLVFHDCRLMHHQRLRWQLDAGRHTPGFDAAQDIDCREQCKLGVVSCHDLMCRLLLAEPRAQYLCRRLREVSRPIVHEGPALWRMCQGNVSS